MQQVFEILGAGGDVATMLLAIALWKFDRRLVVLETLLRVND